MGATDYFEMPGSPKESSNVSNGVASATRVFKCAWADRYIIKDRLLYDYDTKAYEYDDNLWAVDCSIEPFDSPPIAESALNKKAVYDSAILTVKYETVTGYSSNPAAEGNVTGAEFCSQTMSIETQVISVTSGTLYWDEGNTKALDDGEAPAKQFYIKDYSITLHNITTWDSAFDTLTGSINIAAYQEVMTAQGVRTNTRVGNFLYKGYTTQRTISGFGTAGWDLTLNFSEMMNNEESNAWNYFYNPTTQLWSRIYNASGLIEIYKPADWSKLALPPIYVED